ncbi:MAG: biotin/lipoyl-containing protein [Proteocatella sp.]
MKYIATLNGKKYEVEIEKIYDYQPLSRGEAVAAPILAPVQAKMVQPIQVVKDTKKTSTPEPIAAAEGKDVISPMPGTVWDVKVKEGQAVKAGQVILMLEAMKMENEIVAPIDGIISSILVKKGDAVDTDAILAVLK